MRCRPHVALLLLAATFLSGVATADDDVDAAVGVIERFAKDPFEQKERTQAIRRLGTIGGPDAVVALFPLFRDPFVHLRDHATSAWITMLKGSRADTSRDALISKGLPHRLPGLRRGAATALGLAGGPDARAALEKRLTVERDPQVQVALVDAIGRLGLPGAPAVSRLVAQGRGLPLLALADVYRRRAEREPTLLDVPALPRRPREALARAAALHLDAAGNRLRDTHIEAALADDAEPVRLALAEVARDAADDHPWIDAALPRLLADPSWRVRSLAIEACRRHPSGARVKQLIERIDLEEGRLRLDVLLALQSVTGQTIDDDPVLWRAWWEAQGASYEATRRGGGDAHVGPDSVTTTRAFFRLPIHSKHLAFLIDCSGSMRDDADPDQPERGTKFDRARTELEKTLSSLGKDTSFDVFLYRYPSDFPPRPQMTRAFGRLTPATTASVRKAVRWLAGQEARGWGAFYDGLVEVAAEDVDTIYFLSDGRPSRGTYDRDFRLLDEFERVNRFRRVAVHTVLVGRSKADRAFLKDLARRTGGLFADATRD